MNELREYIQARLIQITDIQSGVPIPDDIVESNKTYFGYEVQDTFSNTDFDKFETRRVSVIGFLVYKDDGNTNTLLILDEALAELREAFKDLNLKATFRDVTLEKHIRKIRVSCDGKYNEMNYELII